MTQPRQADPMICSFGATRVGTLFERLRLHLSTDRFLARRRGDAGWDAACEYAAMTLGELQRQHGASGLDGPLPPRLQEKPVQLPALPASSPQSSRVARARWRARLAERASLRVQVASLRVKLAADGKRLRAAGRTGLTVRGGRR